MNEKIKKTETEFDFKTLTTFEDCCNKQGYDPTALPGVDNLPEHLRKPLIAVYKLMVENEAVNNGWKSDYKNPDQKKHFIWSRVLPSGVGFDYSFSFYGYADASVGVRLQSETPEKALYVAETFNEDRENFMLYKD